MNLSHSILATLTYSDHFGFPLTLPELHLRLIKAKVTRAQLRAALTRFPSTRGYYHLPGRSTLIARRINRAHLSSPLLQRANRFVAKLKHFPGVLAIYLTGSLAMQNTNGKGDIDFMVICKPGRLWTTRLLLTLYTTLRSWRRTPHTRHSSGKLCLNLYLTPNSYRLIPDHRSLYTAYELVQAMPLYDPHHTHSALLSANSWIKEYLPNFPLPTTRVDPSQSKGSTLSILEKLAYTLQLRYMSRKITRELVTPDAAFFHPHDPGAKVLRKLSLVK